MENNTIKNHIEIEGVILTSKALEELRRMQEHNNNALDCHIEDMADCVCFLASNFYQLSREEDVKQAIEIIESISMIRDYLKSFKKP